MLVLAVPNDSCHSGTVLDLPFVYHAPAGDEFAGSEKGGGGLKSMLGRHDLGHLAKSITGGVAGLTRAVATEVATEVMVQGSSFVRPVLNAKLNTSKADVIMFSGCRDEQVR